jgi:hypothetical protein
MKCEVCKSKIETTFLGKIVGTVVKDAKGKKHHLCSACHRKLRAKKEMLASL